jgi:hypothetical protein
MTLEDWMPEERREARASRRPVAAGFGIALLFGIAFWSAIIWLSM